VDLQQKTGPLVKSYTADNGSSWWTTSFQHPKCRSRIG